MAILLASKDQNFVQGYLASSKPVLDVILETLRPDLYELPSLILPFCVESLDICHAWLVPTHHIDVPLLDRHRCREISILVEFWLFSPLVPYHRVYLTRF